MELRPVRRLAILGAIGRAAHQGAIIKGGVYLEQLAKIDTVLLDKTGTLTYGKPHVASIEPADGYEADELLHIAASRGTQFRTPACAAVVAAAHEKPLVIGEPSSFSYTPGKGVRATVDGHYCRRRQYCLAERSERRASGDEHDGRSASSGRAAMASFIGSIHIADQVRDGAAQAIRELQEMGLRN